MDISAMDPTDIQQLFDADVIGDGGQKVGIVQQIFADDVTGAATFVTVRADDGREYFIPVRGAQFATRQVVVPFTREVIESAPQAEADNDLSRAQEAEVYGHYGMEPARRSRISTDDDEDVDFAGPGRGSEESDEEVPEQPTGTEDVRPSEPVEGDGDRSDDIVPAAVARTETSDEAQDEVVGPTESDEATSEETDETASAGNELDRAALDEEGDVPTAVGEGTDRPTTEPHGPGASLGLPEGAQLRRYVVTDLVTVQIPVRREVVCWVDADGQVHEIDQVDAPEEARNVGVPGQATWWFNDGPDSPAG